MSAFSFFTLNFNGQEEHLYVTVTLLFKIIDATAGYPRSVLPNGPLCDDRNVLYLCYRALKM